MELYRETGSRHDSRGAQHSARHTATIRRWGACDTALWAPRHVTQGWAKASRGAGHGERCTTHRGTRVRTTIRPGLGCDTAPLRATIRSSACGLGAPGRVGWAGCALGAPN